MTTLYETDFYAWTQRQAELLRSEEFAEVDWNNLIMDEAFWPEANRS